MQALLSQVVANRQLECTVEYRIFRPSGEVRWIESRSLLSYDGDGHPRRVIGVTIDVTDRKHIEEHQRKLVAELDHRVKNTLATVSAVATRTQETSGSMAEFVVAFDGRIKSMAITHELLSQRNWHGIPLAELVRRELAAYATANNTHIQGPDVMLDAEGGQILAMALHELATNAAKFGAISAKAGCVSVRWSLTRNGHANSALCIDWQETGGPQLVRPVLNRAGFGTNVIRELVPYELGGTVDYAFAPDGVICKFKIPARWVCISGNEAGSKD
jgi:two-component sensor histidine kinase